MGKGGKGGRQGTGHSGASVVKHACGGGKYGGKGGRLLRDGLPRGDDAAARSMGLTAACAWAYACCRVLAAAARGVLHGTRMHACSGVCAVVASVLADLKPWP